MRRCAAVILALGAGMFGATAMAQQPAVDQYSTTPPAGTTTGATVTGAGAGTVSVPAVTTPTTPGGNSGKPPGSGKPGAGKSGSGSGKPAAGKPGSASGKPGSGKPVAPSGAAADPLGNRVALIQFGTAPKRLRNDILVALRQAGLRVMFNGDSTKARLAAFLASPLAKLLSTKGVGPVGQAFGAQLVQVTPLARRAFPVLFGPRTQFIPVIRAVLTRRDSLTDKQAAFQTGVTKGLVSTDIPLAYVERTDRKTPSLVKEYRKLGVLTVNNIDTPAGKVRLGKIMLGLIKSHKAVNAIKVKPASQLTGTGGNSPGATPWVILAVLAAGATMFMTGTLRRRGRRSA